MEYRMSSRSGNVVRLVLKAIDEDADCWRQELSSIDGSFIWLCIKELQSSGLLPGDVVKLTVECRDGVQDKESDTLAVATVKLSPLQPFQNRAAEAQSGTSALASHSVLRNLGVWKVRPAHKLVVQAQLRTDDGAPVFNVRPAGRVHLAVPRYLAGAAGVPLHSGPAVFSPLSNVLSSLLDGTLIKAKNDGTESDDPTTHLSVRWRRVRDWIVAIAGSPANARSRGAASASRQNLLKINAKTEVVVSVLANPGKPVRQIHAVENLSPRDVAEMTATRLGGVKKLALTLAEHVIPLLCGPRTLRTHAAIAAGAVVLGPSGSGKSAFVNAFAAAVQDLSGHAVQKFELNSTHVFRSDVVGDAERNIKAIFAAARRSGPSIVCLDDLASLASERGLRSTLQSRSVCTFLLEEIRQCSQASSRVAVIATTSSLADIDHDILASDCLGALKLVVPALALNERLDILEVIIGRSLDPGARDTTASMLQGLDGGRSDPRDAVAASPQLSSILSWVASATAGFLAADLQALCREAVLQLAASGLDTRQSMQAQPSTVALKKEHFEKALYYTRPSLLKTSDRFSDDVALRFDDSDPSRDGATVGSEQLRQHPFAHLPGLASQHRRLSRAVLRPLADPSELQRFGLPNPRGVLLYGPPGTGKTATGLALRQACRGFANFLCVTCTAIVDKVLGATEKAISRVFAQARSVAPCILFLDQIEALAPVRGNDQSSELTFDRLLSCLLTEMDGVASSSSGSREMVVVVATTADKRWLDQSILRPGRLDEHIEFRLPTRRDRREVFRHLLQALPLDFAQDSESYRSALHKVAVDIESVDEGGDRDYSSSSESDCDDSVEAINKERPQFAALLEALAATTSGLAHADLVNGVREAAMAGLRRDLQTPAITDIDLLQVFAQNVP